MVVDKTETINNLSYAEIKAYYIISAKGYYKGSSAAKFDIVFKNSILK